MSDHWGTPDSIFELIEEHIDRDIRLAYDPCPFRGTDGLHVEKWPEGGTVFINPPFSDPEPFIKMAHAWQANRNSRRVIIVLPAFTDRKWWLRTVQPMLIPYAHKRHCYFIGRHRYIPLDGQKESSPRFGSCLLTIGYPVSHSLAIGLSQTRRRNAKRGKKPANDAGDGDHSRGNSNPESGQPSNGAGENR